MISNTQKINEAIESRRRLPSTQYCETTYYNTEGYAFWVDNQFDPDVLFKIKCMFSYAKKFKWNKEETQEFIQNNINESRSHISDGIEYFYDWGAGDNKTKISNHWHLPHLDHIIPRSEGGNDSPSNLRIRCSLLNQNKSNTNTDAERYATIIDFWNDIEDKSRYSKNLLDMIGQSCYEK